MIRMIRDRHHQRPSSEASSCTLSQMTKPLGPDSRSTRILSSSEPARGEPLGFPGQQSRVGFGKMSHEMVKEFAIEGEAFFGRAGCRGRAFLTQLTNSSSLGPARIRLSRLRDRRWPSELCDRRVHMVQCFLLFGCGKFQRLIGVRRARFKLAA